MGQTLSHLLVHMIFSTHKRVDWQNGYAAFSVSESMAPRVIAYIKNQREHHKTVSFMDELREICKRHGVEIDEDHAWD